MIGAVVKTALLIEVLQLTAGVVGQSPCPTYFWYNYNPVLNKMIGHIQISSPPKGVPLTLNLTLNFAVPVNTGQKNEIKLAESIEDTIKAINEGKPLMYEIHFSIQESLPLVTNLMLNGKVFCSGHPPIAKNITRVVLTHTLDVPKLTKGIHNQNDLGHHRSNTNRNDSLPAAGAKMWPSFVAKNSCNVCQRYGMYSLITIYFAHLLCSKLMLREYFQ